MNPYEQGLKALELKAKIAKENNVAIITATQKKPKGQRLSRLGEKFKKS
jgi:hypothetical protein